MTDTLSLRSMCQDKSDVPWLSRQEEIYSFAKPVLIKKCSVTHTGIFEVDDLTARRYEPKQ